MKWCVLGIGLLIALGLTACGGDDNGNGSGTPQDSTIDPAEFQSTVDNAFFPLTSPGPAVFEGEEVDPDTGEVVEIRVESTALAATNVVAGVEATVVEVKEFEDGELVEVTLDYYAQRSDGAVYYFGEQVDNYEGGEVVGHEGQWLAGEGDNLPGVFMPADPEVGDEFEQERAPGVAEDRSEVVEVDESVTTPAGSFSGCIKTKDFDPLGDVTEFKYYCPNVGLVREETDEGETLIDLVSF